MAHGTGRHSFEFKRRHEARMRRTGLRSEDPGLPTVRRTAGRVRTTGAAVHASPGRRRAATGLTPGCDHACVIDWTPRYCITPQGRRVRQYVRAGGVFVRIVPGAIVHAMSVRPCQHALEAVSA